MNSENSAVAAPIMLTELADLASLAAAHEVLKGRLGFRTPNNDGTIVFGVVKAPPHIEAETMYSAIAHPGLSLLLCAPVRKLTAVESAEVPSYMLMAQVWGKGSFPGAMAMVVRETGIPSDTRDRWVMVYGIGRLGLQPSELFVEMEGNNKPPLPLDAKSFIGSQPGQILRQPLWADDNYALCSLLPPGVTLADQAHLRDPKFAEFRREFLQRAPWAEGRTYYTKQEHEAVERISREIVAGLVAAKDGQRENKPGDIEPEM